MGETAQLIGWTILGLVLIGGICFLALYYGVLRPRRAEYLEGVAQSKQYQLEQIQKRQEAIL